MSTDTRSASQAQLSYIADLLAQKDLTPDYIAQAEDLLVHGLTMVEASRWIDSLKTKPKKQGANGGSPNSYITVEYETVLLDKDKERRIGYLTSSTLVQKVPQGNYALDDFNPDSENDITFYHIWVGDRGGWKVYLCHGPDETELPKYQGARIVQTISEDLEGALARYGHNVGRCGICGLRLTNKVSRDRGIGPICYSRL